jgi:hypothetical protein
MAKKVLQTRIEIQASPEQVWQILTDFAPRFPEWNPGGSSAGLREMKPREGETLEVLIQPSGGKEMTFRPVVLKVAPAQELRWRARLGIPGLFTGEHIFKIETVNDGRVRFIQREEFSGLLVGSWASRSEEDTWRGFREMNKALKDRAELGRATKPPEETG